MARSLLRAFPIQQLLQQPQQTRSWELAEPVEGFESLTPVQGELTVRHGHSFLEVTATAETIVNLTCDRCLWLLQPPPPSQYAGANLATG
ncbi:unknown protein [Synechococcus elongatus PCC 6301]|uniref:DUF177 domain-containing protein n=1 Tax=Synechococcus sp. (strain ATCC 27144 / PCC 6301 / SAUG 1402/1) TaxID=269084 RepID=A0A0H3JZP5_SYNP6|nr:hypothetical protein [Synechococcus elongatus]BAD78266.1 unknown protein [Synechococcus elongatus PCC 6301]